MNNVTVHPITWPAGVPRVQRRQESLFKTTIEKALKNVENSLKLFAENSGKKLENVVISSNYALGVKKPADPSIAVWFTWDGLDVCITGDKYDKIEDNLQAVHHIIEARRVELRHGSIHLIRQTMRGFKALPAPKEGVWELLGISETRDKTTIEKAYKVAASKIHPNNVQTGDNEAFLRLKDAYDTLIQSFN